MKGELTKNYSFGIIVKVEDLLYLDKYLRTVYPFIKYEIKVSNGAKYKLNTLEDIIEYDNPSSRKIVAIYLYANKQGNDPIFPDFELSILTSHFLSTTISFVIRRASQEEIDTYSYKVNELIRNFRSPYYWINTVILPIILGLLLYGITSLTFYNSFSKYNERAFTFLLFVTLSLLCGWLGFIVYRWMILWLFPKNIILIGKQISINENKKKWRYTIGTVIILGLIVGVIANIIACHI